MHVHNAQSSFFILIIVLLAVHPTLAGSATLLVDSLDDVIINDTSCTLREAATAANTDSDGNGCVGDGSYGADLIIFSQPGQINLIDELEISDDLEIGGDGGITLDAIGNNRIIRAAGDGLALRLEGIRLQNGSPTVNRRGGCIQIFGANVLLETNDVIFQDCTVSTNSFLTAFGGAIDIGRSSGGRAATGSTQTKSSRSSNGPVMVTTLSLNRTTIADSFVAAEDGSAIGGAIYAGPDPVAIIITDSRIRNNGVRSFNGRAEGGGLYLVAPPSIDITRSELSFNDAQSLGNNTRGGAIFIEELEGAGTINNSTIGNNQSLSFGPAGSEARAGAIFGTVDDDVTLSLNNVTIANNATIVGSVASAFSGAFEFTDNSGPVFLANTILGGNTAAEQPSDCAATGVIVSRGHNIVESNCGITSTTGDLFGIEPELGLLAANGGALSDMESFLPLPTSPALDAGSPEPVNSSPTACQATDQRGETRPADAGAGLICDIGAIELQPPALVAPRPVPALNSLALMIIAVLMLLLGIRTATRH